jgi:5'-phosphate synthase pdxT subunit
MPKPIGVLALQGDVREHRQTFAELGIETIEVKRPEQLELIRGLVLPGGESSVIEKLSKIYGLYEPIKSAIQGGLPVFGTCAGLIMLANKIEDAIEGQEGFGGLNAVVRRNAFGHQVDSFEADLPFTGIDGLVHAAFIRAPLIESVGDGVEIVSTLPDGGIVGIRQGKLLGISFHPEVTGEHRIHRLFDSMCA